MAYPVGFGIYKDAVILNVIEKCSWVLIGICCIRKSTLSSAPEIMDYDEGLALNCSNPIANTLELLQSRANPSVKGWRDWPT